MVRHMIALLRLVLIAFGLTSMAIALSMGLFGPAPVGDTFATLLGLAVPVEGLANANVDSEMRFYSVYFAAFGAITVHTGWHLSTQQHLVPWLALLFFASGTARGLSWLALGPPHPLFAILLAIELTLPIVLIILWRATRDQSS